MLRPGDASVAAPFTSRTPSVRAVVDLIRQGWCSEHFKAIYKSVFFTLFKFRAIFISPTSYLDLTLSLSVFLSLCSQLLNISFLTFSSLLISLFHPLSLSLPLSFTLSLSISLYLCLSLYISIYLSLSSHTPLFAYIVSSHLTASVGRCTLLSALMQQQIMMLESIIAAYTLSALSLHNARSSERQMMASSW